MATSRTISGLRESRHLRSRPPPALTGANQRGTATVEGSAQQVVQGDVPYIIKMAPAVLRRRCGIYSLDWCKDKGSNLSELLSNPVPFILSTKFLRSFSTFRDLDSLHSHQSNPSKATASQPNNNNYNSPPERIPDRPLRGERNSVYPSARQQNEQRTQLRFRDNENPKREKSSLEDSDLLEKFKLGFDRNKGENPNPKQSPNYSQRGGDKYDQAAAESPPSQPPEDADEIFRKMKETGLIPNAVAMLDGLCKDGLVQEAMKLFGLMREKGTMPEVVIYTAVVEGFCKAQKLDDAVRIFRKMQSNGITPNAFSYTILIQGLYRGTRLDDAREFCLEMLENGHSPNVVTFTGLVDGFCREKGLEEAQTMISTLRQKGFFLDEKAIREYLEKKGPFLPLVWEAILGKKAPQSSSFFS